ncbi:cytochrome P450 [Rhodococcoides corynebacterioides]|uniref:cytochrome P450 n=1 Tax=Rhodococcoides corynebacterioides TaxID=53972 RepID=UPI003F7E53BA
MNDNTVRPVRASDRVLPHPPRRLPVVGDILDLHVTESSQWAMRDAQKYGSIYERNVFGTRVTYVSGPVEVAAVNDETTWAKFLGVPMGNLRQVAGDGLFTAYNSEPSWATAHAILAPAFSQSSMRRYHDTMVGKTEQLLSSWTARGPGAWIDVPADMNKLALGVIGEVAFGYDFGSFDDAAPHELVVRISRALKYINRAAYSHPAVEATIYRRERDQHRDDIVVAQRLVDDIVATRREHDAPGSGDLLDLMLSTADPATGERLSDQNIRNQILTFLVAGQETSAGVMAFALHFLSTHPDVVERIRAELSSVCPDGDLQFDHVGKLRYLRRVVDETLRLWPVAPGYYRKARRDTMVGEHPFERGEWVFVVLLQLHRDAAWGADPERFDPDRFERSRVPVNLADLYKPFGTGLRGCIGRQFAYHEVLVALALIVGRVDLVGNPDYSLKVDETVTLKPRDFSLQIRERSDPVA